LASPTPSRGSAEDVAHRRRLPLPAARRVDAARVQRRRDLSQRLGSCSLGLSNSRHDGVGVGVGPCPAGGVGYGAGVGEARIAQQLASCLCGGESGLRALGNEGSLLLGQSGVQVQQERLDVRTQLGDQERRLVRHEAADEMLVTRQAV